MTSRVIAVGQRKQKDHCFFIKHSPGTRKTDIISNSQSSTLKEMLFISNDKLLLRFKDYALTVHIDGHVIDQDNPEVQKIIDDISYKNIGRL